MAAGPPGCDQAAVPPHSHPWGGCRRFWGQHRWESPGRQRGPEEHYAKPYAPPSLRATLWGPPLSPHPGSPSAEDNPEPETQSNSPSSYAQGCLPPKKTPGATSRILPAPDPPVPPLPHPLLLQGCWWGSVTKCPPLGAHNKIGALGHPHPRRGGSVGRDRAVPGVWWGRNAGTARESHAGEPGPDPGPRHPPGKLTSWRMSSSLGMMESSSTSSLRGEGTEGGQGGRSRSPHLPPGRPISSP